MPLFDLSARAKLRLSGGDRLRFLNGQVTNDVRKANPHLSLPACVISAKGKLDAFVFIAGEPEAFLLDAEAELREPLAARLDRYLIADEVTLADVTEELALFHLIADAPPSPPSLPNEQEWRRARRFGVAGWDLLAPAAERDRLRQELSAIAPLGSAAEAERLRIEQGVPRWGNELTDQIIPVEANLADEAIDYAKGCYIGQEVISRMKMSGQTNKRLRGLVALDNLPLTPETRLLSPDGAKEVGWLTSATRSERLDREIALGFVKRGFNDPGTKLLAGSRAVEVVELPFA